MTAPESPDADRADRCPSCSTELDPGARFCHACGARAEPPVATPGSSGSTSLSSSTPSAASVASADPQPTPPRTARADSPGLHRQTPGSVLCAACGAPNAAEREICGACGADVVTGETGLAADPVPVTLGPVASARAAERPGARRWWIPVLAILAVVGFVVGALALLEVGPFASPEVIPPVDYPEDRYSGEPETLALTDVATLTMRPPEGDRTFTPERMVDGDLLTSWHGDASALPPDTDEKVDLFLEDPAWVTAVVLANGDHQDADAYADAARIQRAELVFDGDARVAATLLDQGLEPQIVELSEPLLTTALRIEIVETVPGLESEDVALSRVELLGHAADAEDAEVAHERAEVRPAAGAIQLPAR